MDINHLKQNIVIRCDASSKVGFGHVVRCLALADELQKQQEQPIYFAMLEGRQGVESIEEKGYQVFFPTKHQTGEWDEGKWLKQVVAKVKAAVLILDVRTELRVVTIRELRRQGILIVTIDDPSERRLEADLAFYPPVPQVEHMDWSRFTGQLFVGWEWIILRPEFFRIRELKKQAKNVKNGLPPLTLLVTMGGSDPAGLTLKTLKVLDEQTEDFRTMVILGQGFNHEELQQWLQHSQRSYELHWDVKDMAGLMAEVDLAIASFGVTAYELAAMGVPAVYFCLTDDHVESASTLDKMGIGINLGLHEDAKVKTLSTVINRLIADIDYYRAMKARTQILIDGCGVYRIARHIGQKLRIYDEG